MIHSYISHICCISGLYMFKAGVMFLYKGQHVFHIAEKSNTFKPMKYPQEVSFCTPGDTLTPPSESLI